MILYFLAFLQKMHLARCRRQGAGTHEELLGKVQNTFLGLRRRLVEMGVRQDTLIVVQSEFGRRPNENATGGTDMGLAARCFWKLPNNPITQQGFSPLTISL